MYCSWLAPWLCYPRVGSRSLVLGQDMWQKLASFQVDSTYWLCLFASRWQLWALNMLTYEGSYQDGLHKASDFLEWSLCFPHLLFWPREIQTSFEFSSESIKSFHEASDSLTLSFSRSVLSLVPLVFLFIHFIMRREGVLRDIDGLPLSSGRGSFGRLNRPVADHLHPFHLSRKAMSRVGLLCWNAFAIAIRTLLLTTVGDLLRQVPDIYGSPSVMTPIRAKDSSESRS